MDYNYLNSANQNHHPAAEYGHPSTAHSQHGLYQQPVPLHQPAQVPYPPSLLSPHFRLPVSLHEQGDLGRNQHVVTVSGHDVQTTLHQLQAALPGSQTPLMGYQTQNEDVRQLSQVGNTHVNGQHNNSQPSVGLVGMHDNIKPSSGAPSRTNPSPATTQLTPSNNRPGVPGSINDTPQTEMAPVVVQIAPQEIAQTEQLTTAEDADEPSENDEDEGVQNSLGGPLPEGLKYKKAGDAPICVIADRVIGKGVKFGPFKGAFGKGTMHFNNNLSWELTLQGCVVGFLSPIKGERAWTTMIRCARFPEELTVEASQYCGRIYFTTTREIQPGEEIRVFYSEDYRKSCGFKLGLKDLTFNKELKSFECNFCPCHCSTTKNLLRHMKLFHHKEKHTAIDVNVPVVEKEVPSEQEAIVQSLPAKTERDKTIHAGDAATERFICTTCGKHFSSQGRLIVHENFHRDADEDLGEEEDYPCDKCGYLCPSLLSLADHTHRHKKAPYGCNECGRVYTQRTLVYRHKREKHGSTSTQKIPSILRIRLRVRKNAENACQHCRYACLNPKVLAKHIEKHKSCPYGCPECGKVYSQRATLLTHLKEKHCAPLARPRQEPMEPAGTEEFQCSHCGFNCEDEVAHVQHTERHKRARFGCDLCGLVYTQRQFVGRHKRMKHGIVLPEIERPEKPRVSSWACDVCDKNYATIKSLRRHQKEKHGHMSEPRYVYNTGILPSEGHGDFECDLCVETFTTVEDFNAHLQQAHGIEPNPKGKRGFAISTIDAGTQRKAGHVPGEAHNKLMGGTLCYICGKTFLKWSFLHAHLRRHHGIEPLNKQIPSQSPETIQNEQNVPDENTSIEVKSEQIDMLGKPVDYYNRPRPFKCQQCPRRFTYRHILKRHEYRAHLGGSKFTCSFCQKGFCQESQLLVHMQTHTKNRPFKCALCTRSFASQNACDNHQGEHTGAKPHKCDVCGRGFGTRKLVNKHKYRVHSNKEKRFKCSFCEKRFLCSKDHRVHERRHKGIRPFVCLTCGKAFKDKHCMVVHKRVHTGEKPYVCPQCGKAYSLSHRLTDHIVMHTKENMEQAAAVSGIINSQPGVE